MQMMLSVPDLTLSIMLPFFTTLALHGKVMLKPVATDSFLLPRSQKQFLLQGVFKAGKFPNFI